jgi:acyl-CoA thioesterase FadM
MIETYRGVVFPLMCDQQGHLTTSQYAVMFDIASYHLMDRLVPRAQAVEGLSWADISHHTQFLREVCVGELILIRSVIVRVGGSSIEYEHVMSTTDISPARSRLRGKTVRFDLATRKSAPLGDELKDRAEALVGEFEV